jgi:hypothetical protein
LLFIVIFLRSLRQSKNILCDRNIHNKKAPSFKEAFL